MVSSLLPLCTQHLPKTLQAHHLHVPDGPVRPCNQPAQQSTEQAASTLHKVGQGLRGALSTNRNTVMLNSGGSTHDSAPAKRPSETGSTRLWNWLQKAETPGSLDTRPEANLQTVSCFFGLLCLGLGVGPTEQVSHAERRVAQVHTAGAAADRMCQKACRPHHEESVGRSSAILLTALMQNHPTCPYCDYVGSCLLCRSYLFQSVRPNFLV